MESSTSRSVIPAPWLTLIFYATKPIELCNSSPHEFLMNLKLGSLPILSQWQTKKV